MVAVKAHEVDRALARLDPKIRVVLFYGPDQGLVSERAAALAKASVDDPSDPFQLVRLDGDNVASDPLRLADEANTIGLFGGRRVVRVSPSARSLAPAVEPLLQTPPIDAIVIIEGGDIAKGNPLRVQIERAACALAAPCYSDETRGVDALIDPILAPHGLRIGREARTLLVARLGSDRMLSRQEIEKLALYAHGEGEIGVEHVEAIVGDTSAQAFNDVVDAAFAGDNSRLDRSFARLMAEGEDAGVLLSIAVRHAATLMAARRKLDASGEDVARFVAGMFMPFPRRGAVEAALRRLSTEQFARAIVMLDQALLQVRRVPALDEAIALRALWNVRRL